MTKALGTDDLERLRAAAESARVMSWAPYTGAVVLASVRTTHGHYYGGTNVEVANITLSKHAEEAAIMAALAAGALSTPDGGKERRCIDAVYTTASPCGSCRQFILEFATDRCVVHIDGGPPHGGTFRLLDLLPHAFGPAEQLAAGGHLADGQS